MNHKSSKLLLGFGFAAAAAAEVDVVGAVAGVELVRIGGDVGDMAPPNIDV
jgi:hypothetical protein